MAEVANRLRGLVLSATELSAMTDWPSALIEDYLNIIENLILIAESLDIEIQKKLEETATDFATGSVPFVSGGFLSENNNFRWDNDSSALLIGERDVIRYVRRNC